MSYNIAPQEVGEVRRLHLEGSEQQWTPSVRLYLAFATLAVITMMVALDGTSLSVALPLISDKLGGTAIEAFWSGTSFLLCSTIFQPSFASFSHIFGRKPMIMTGLVFFVAGAIVAAVSHNFGVLLVGRSLQGIGGGGLIALTEIVVTDLVPLRLRGQWFGVISAMWALAYEEVVAAEPLIRLVIFKNRTSAVSYVATVLHGMILWSLLYYLPLYYEAVKGFSPIISGIALFPQTFTVAPSTMVVGILITVTGRYRWAIWSGWVLTVLGTGLLYLLDVDTSVVEWIFLNLVGGLGMGMLFPSMAFAIQASQKNKDLAFAVAMFSFFRAFGQALGVAVGGTVFQNQIKTKLLAYPALASKAYEYSRDASSLVQIIKAMKDDVVKEDLQHAYADSLKVVWLTMCGLAGVGLILSLWTKGLDMNKPLETEQGFIEQKKVKDEEKR
ncbi:MAG: hypothetical protein Q9188_006344 [Gyalolechia gomerana]